jgi:hypothetical protein
MPHLPLEGGDLHVVLVLEQVLELYVLLLELVDFGAELTVVGAEVQRAVHHSRAIVENSGKKGISTY